MKYYEKFRDRLVGGAAPGPLGAASRTGAGERAATAASPAGVAPRHEPGKPGKPPTIRPPGGFPGFPGSWRVPPAAGDGPWRGPAAVPTAPAGAEPGSDRADARWVDELRGWPEGLREAWEERAAILEYEAGFDRAVAERKAFDEIATRAGLVTPPAREAPAEPGDFFDRIEGWLRWHGFTEVDPAELDSYAQVPLPIPAEGRREGPWRCENPYCLHKGRWWKSYHGVTNCWNCRPPAFRDLVLETGGHEGKL